MKYLFIAILLSSSLSALANPAGQFIGKYSVAPSQGQTECRLGVDATRAYISLNGSPSGMKVLSIRSFGIESRMTEIPVETGLRQAPGSREQDQVIERVSVTFPTPKSMRVSVRTEAPHMKSFEEVTTLALQGGVLVVNNRKSSDPRLNSSCVLTKK